MLSLAVLETHLFDYVQFFNKVYENNKEIADQTSLKVNIYTRYYLGLQKLNKNDVIKATLG